MLHQKTIGSGNRIESRNIVAGEEENLRNGEYFDFPDRILHPQEYEAVTVINN